MQPNNIDTLSKQRYGPKCVCSTCATRAGGEQEALPNNHPERGKPCPSCEEAQHQEAMDADLRRQEINEFRRQVAEETGRDDS